MAKIHDPEQSKNIPVHLSAEYKSRQRKRSIAIAVGLVLLVVIFYTLTIVKIGPELFSRDL